MKNNWTYTALPEDPDTNPESYNENKVLHQTHYSNGNHSNSCFSLKTYRISQLKAGCVTNLFVDDAMIFASGDSVGDVKLKLQNSLNDIITWYWVNCLKFYSNISKVMLVGSKAQLKSWNVDKFILNYKGTPLELVKNA